jgi:hypothetical protein
MRENQGQYQHSGGNPEGLPNEIERVYQEFKLLGPNKNPRKVLALCSHQCEDTARIR